jgi:hypothetical protein
MSKFRPISPAAAVEFPALLLQASRAQMSFVSTFSSRRRRRFPEKRHVQKKPSERTREKMQLTKKRDNESREI